MGSQSADLGLIDHYKVSVLQVGLQIKNLQECMEM